MPFRFYLLLWCVGLALGVHGQVDSVRVQEQVADSMPEADSLVQAATAEIDSTMEEEVEPDTAGFWRLRKDTAALVKRGGLSGELQRYRDDKAYQYTLQPAESLSAWERFWRWFWGKWYELMSNEGSRTIVNFLLWVLAIGVLLYVILRLVGADKVALWLGRNQRAGLAMEEVEDIHAIAYTDAIREAEAAGRYREAIRYRFLQAMKALTDKNIIQWHRHKTNVDYARELASHPVLPAFEQVRRIYEYAWYGEFDVTEGMYQAIDPAFQQFHKQVGA